MAKTQTYTTFGGTSGAIHDIGGARANANVEGAVGRAARAFITEWEAEQKRKKELNSLNYAAAQGRVMDGSTYAMLRGRLEAQAAAAVQKVQSDYEQKRMEYALNAMQMKNDVYKNTNNVVMDYNDVANILKAMAGQK